MGSGRKGAGADNQGMTMLTQDEVDRRMSYLEMFEVAQAHVRRRFGLAERDAGALRRVAEVYNPPGWAAGCISMHDAMFLYDLVRGIRPRRMVEIGVATGASTALLLHALTDAGLGGEGVLQSYELLPYLYFDRSKPVGCLVPELAGGLEGLWRMHVGKTAKEAGKDFSGDGLTLVFIDGDHRHPAPTADLLWLMPALADGAWVALHDIDLPNVALAHERRTGEKVGWHQRGAKELFDGWPFEKIRGGTIGEDCGGMNIGAIRVPAGVKAKDLAHIVGKPWEMESNRGLRKVLGAGARS